MQQGHQKALAAKVTAMALVLCEHIADTTICFCATKDVKGMGWGQCAVLLNSQSGIHLQHC